MVACKILTKSATTNIPQIQCLNLLIFILVLYEIYHLFYISTNKTSVLHYFKELQLQLEKVPVTKSSSLKINLQF